MIGKSTTIHVAGAHLVRQAIAQAGDMLRLAMDTSTRAAIANVVDVMRNQQAEHVAAWRNVEAIKSIKTRTEMQRAVYRQP